MRRVKTGQAEEGAAWEREHGKEGEEDKEEARGRELRRL
jgi:hypothetical protein